MYDRIPDELKKLDRWVCWRFEDRDGKPTKVPVNPLTGGRAMSNNPATWGTFYDAVNGNWPDVKGIGFMFNGDGIIGVDLDHCKDPGTRELTDTAKDIVSILDSYTEFSQSGEGIHIICYGKLPQGKKRKGPVEMYPDGRFFIMTGNTIDDGHSEVEERTEQLAIVHKKYLSDTKSNKNVRKSSQGVQKYDDFVILDDRDLIDKAMAAENGSRFKDLFNGDTSRNGKDDSAADLALCNILAFWTGCDASQMDRIFRMSGLFRDKWDEKRGSQTYGEMTIARAIKDCSKVYEPKQRKAKTPAPIQEPPEIDMGYDQLYGAPVEGPIEVTEKHDTASDLGRSKYFSVKYKKQLYWCGGNKAWLIWNGRYWRADDTLQVMQFAKESVDEIIFVAARAMSNATGEEEVKKAKRVYQDTIKAKSERSIKAMIELAKSDLPITTSELDGDPFLLNCENGVVDLRNSKLHPHNPEYKMTKIAGASYLPDTKFKKFHLFLKDVTCGDAELAEYFQQICGMAAIGKVFHEGMCMFYGGGRNGKSTFLNCISKVFGDYACSINPEVLMSQKDGRQQAGGISVEGRRYVITEETEEGRRISPAMLKKLASAGPVTERPLYKDERTFMPSHTLIMATNHLPRIGSTDAGTWRRIAVVPFKAVFEGKKEIKDYATVLYNEDKDAILSWIVEGAIKYIKNDYKIILPEIVKVATKNYCASEDWLGNFISDCCETGEFEESGGNLYDAYREWCNRNNESYVRRSRDFASQLEQQGFEKRRTMHGSVWSGLRLIENAQTSSLSKYRSDKTRQSSLLDDDGLDSYTRSKM